MQQPLPHVLPADEITLADEHQRGQRRNPCRDRTDQQDQVEPVDKRLLRRGGERCAQRGGWTADRLHRASGADCMRECGRMSGKRRGTEVRGHARADLGRESEAEMPNAASRPPTNVGTFSSDRSNIGLGVRYSMTANIPSRTPPAINDPTTCADPQPTSVLRISPNTSATKAALKLTKPAISSGAACASFDSGTRRAVISSATAPTGMLTKKIQRQERPLVIRPPSTGPTATAAPVTAPKTPNAIARSLPRNASASSII